MQRPRKARAQKYEFEGSNRRAEDSMRLHIFSQGLEVPLKQVLYQFSEADNSVRVLLGIYRACRLASPTPKKAQRRWIQGSTGVVHELS